MNMNKRSSLTASDFTMKKMLLRYLVIYALTGLYACDMPDKDLDRRENGLYSLTFSLKDSIGNDIVKDFKMSEWYPKKKATDKPSHGIVDNVLYQMSVSVTPLSPTTFPCHFIIWKSDNDEWMMTADYQITGMRKGWQNTLTYDLLFPEWFGDTKVHKLTARWTVPEAKKNTYHYAVCDYLEIDGQKIDNIVYTAHPDGEKDEKTNLITLIVL